jgi:hypothetical protein
VERRLNGRRAAAAAAAAAAACRVRAHDRGARRAEGARVVSELGGVAFALGLVVDWSALWWGLAVLAAGIAISLVNHGLFYGATGRGVTGRGASDAAAAARA